MLRRDSGPTGSLFERIREAANPPSYQNPKEALLRLMEGISASFGF